MPSDTFTFEEVAAPETFTFEDAVAPPSVPVTLSGPSMQPVFSPSQLPAPVPSRRASQREYEIERARLAAGRPSEDQLREIQRLAEERLQTPIASIPRPIIQAAVQAALPAYSKHPDVLEGLTDAISGATTITPELIDTLPLFSIPVFGEALMATLGAKGVGAGLGQVAGSRTLRERAAGVGTAALSAGMILPVARRTPGVEEFLSRMAPRAAAAAPVTPAPAAAVAPKLEVPSALRQQKAGEVLRGVPQQPAVDVGQVPAPKGPERVPRGVEAQKAAGGPEVSLKPAPSGAFEEVQGMETMPGKPPIRWFEIKEGTYKSTDGGTYGPGSGVSAEQMQMLGFKPPRKPKAGTKLRTAEEVRAEVAAKVAADAAEVAEAAAEPAAPDEVLESAERTRIKPVSAPVEKASPTVSPADIEALAQKGADPKAGRFTKEENAKLAALTPEQRAAFVARQAELKAATAPAPVSPAAPVSAPVEKAAPVAPAAPTAPAAPVDPISALATAPVVKVTLPKEARVLPGKGTPAIRGTDAKGHHADQPASVFAKGNPFQGAGIVKIEAGYIDRATKKFVPVKGDVEVALPTPKAPRAPKPKAKPVAAPVAPEAAAAKVEAEVAKQTPIEATAAKKTLVSELDKALEKAPSEADLTPEQKKALTKVRQIPTKRPGQRYGSTTGGQMVSSPEQMDAILQAVASGLEQVSIDIPGDGRFSTWNVKEILEPIRDAAKRLKTAPTEEAGKIVLERSPGESPRQRQIRLDREDMKDALAVYGSRRQAMDRLLDQYSRGRELDIPAPQMARIGRLLDNLAKGVPKDKLPPDYWKRVTAARLAYDLPPREPVVVSAGPGAAAPLEFEQRAARAGSAAAAGTRPPGTNPPLPISGDLMPQVVRPPKDFNIFNRINSPQWSFWFGKLGEAAKAAWETMALTEFRIREAVGRDTERYVNGILSSLPRSFRRKGGEALFDVLDGRTLEQIEAEWQGRPNGTRVIAAAREVKTRLEEIRTTIRDTKRSNLVSALSNLKKDALIDLFRENVDPNADVSGYTKDALANAISRVEFPEDWGIADGSYLPHMFYGDWRITAQMAGEPEPSFVGRAKTVTEATAQIRQFVKNNPGYADAAWKVGQDTVIPAEMLRLGDRRFWKLVSDLKNQVTSDFDVKAAMQGIIGRKSAKTKWWGNLKARLGFSGYSRQFEKVMSSYLQGFHRWKNLSEATREVVPLIEDVRREGRLAAATELENIWDHLWGKPAQTTLLFDNFIRQVPGVRDFVKPMALERWSRNVRKLVSLGTLQTIRFSLVNRLQPLQGLYPLVGERILGWAKVAQHTAEGRRLLDRGGIRFDVGQWGVEGSLTTKLSRLRERFTGEKSNLEVAYLAMYKHGLERGLSPAEAMNYAKMRGVLMTQFSPLVTDIPPLLRGPIASVFFQFKRFPIKQTELLLKMGANRNLPGLARWLGVTAAMGGIAYFMRQFALPTSLRKNIKDKLAEELGQDGADYVYYGLPGLIGADISGSLALGDEPFGQSLYEKVGRQIVGPTISIAYETGKAAATPRREPLPWYKELESTVRRYPSLRPISELVALISGDVDARSPDGEVRYRRTIRDALRGLGSLRGTKESNISLYTDWMVGMAKEIQNLKNSMFVELSRPNGNADAAMDKIIQFNSRWPEFAIQPQEIFEYLKLRGQGVNKTDVERLAGRRFRAVLSELDQQ